MTKITSILTASVVGALITSSAFSATEATTKGSASPTNATSQSTFKQKVSHDYQVSKNETVNVAKKTGSAAKSGYEKSKGWASKEWSKHENKKDYKHTSDH